MELYRTRRIILAFAVLTSILLIGATSNQEPVTCPVSETPTGCALITLSPATLTGDFYLGETLLATQQNTALLPLPPSVSNKIDVKNIQDTTEGFSVLFIYPDTSKNVTVSEGKVKNYTILVTKKFIRGTGNFTCDVRSVTVTDLIACRVTIDGIPQATEVLPAQSAKYFLDPGQHTFLIELTGDSATVALWGPPSKEQKVTIYAGSTSIVKPSFLKKGHLLIKLNQANVLADFYIDGQLVATQLATTDLWVSPNKNHKVEAKNVTDATSNAIYKWKDAVTFAYLTPGKDKTSTLNLIKQYLKGFLKLTCKINNVQPGENVYCQPSIDGIVVEAILNGETKQYVLDPGSHTVTAVLGPTDLWVSDLVTFSAFIYAGSTSNKTITYTIEQAIPPPPPPAAAVCDCSGNIYNCPNFSSHAQAQACFNYCMQTVGYDVHQLDGDNDGSACESLP